MNGKRAAQWILAGAGVVLMLGGCKTVKKSDYDAAIRENTELRERIAALQDTVRDANEQIDACESEKSSLAQSNQSLQMQLSSRPTPTASSTGFENIPGVTLGGRTDALSVTVAGDVLFASGSATLKSSAKSSLDQIASVLASRYASNPVRIEGYTDTDPIKKSKWKTNERLSSERALAVEEYLVSRGIDSDRVYSAAFGPAGQRGSKQESRRVEIVVLGAS